MFTGLRTIVFIASKGRTTWSSTSTTSTSEQHLAITPEGGEAMRPKISIKRRLPVVGGVGENEEGSLSSFSQGSPFYTSQRTQLPKFSVIVVR